MTELPTLATDSEGTAETSGGQEPAPIERRRERAGVWRAVRPFAFAAITGLALLVIGLNLPEFHPGNPLARYGLRVSAILGVVIGLAALIWCARKAQTWAGDLIASLWAGLGGLTMLIALNGTPFGPLGVFGDQSFRTEYITRLTDAWQIKDYFYQLRPGYYAPTFFWILGRAADLLGVEGWRMMKVAAVLGPFLAPLIFYFFWRRHLDSRIAALVAGVAFLVNDFYEPYGWIVLAALIPWFIEVYYGPQRPGAKPFPLWVLGLAGGIMFSIYYYYFFLIPFFFLVQLAWNRWVGKNGWGLRNLRRPIIVLAISAAVSSFFWLPLLINFLTARSFASLNNRWLVADHGDIELSVLSLSVTGLLCLGGLIYLLLTARTRLLSQGLLLVVAAAYLWHVAGFFLAAANNPVMSFRMKIIVPVALISAAVIGLWELVRWALGRFDREHARWVSVVMLSFLTLFAADRYVSDILGNDWIRQAHNATLPDGNLPRYHDGEAKAVKPAAQDIKALVDKGFKGPGHPVVLSDRIDLMAFYPYYGFVQWNSSYSHPTAEFAQRIAFLNGLGSLTPAEFAERTANNPYDRIDAFVMPVEGETVAFYYTQDKYPNGAGTYNVSLPKRLFDPAYFEVTTIDNLMVATRR
jgi:galactan 5-O-arabinofuranosyltransferase